MKKGDSDQVKTDLTPDVISKSGLIILLDHQFLFERIMVRNQLTISAIKYISAGLKLFQQLYKVYNYKLVKIAPSL